MKVEVDVLGSLSLMFPTFSLDVKATFQKEDDLFGAQELCQSRVAVLGFPSLTDRMVSVDVMQHWTG